MCGLTLQKTDPLMPGFYRDKMSEKPVRPEDIVARKAYQGLDDDDLKLLLETTSPEDLAEFRQELSPLAKKAPEITLCVRCRDAVYRSQYNPDDFPIEPVDSIMESIPPDANLVYVINAADFPMSLDPRVFLYRPASQFHFVVTKCDLLFPTENLANRYGTTFFQDYLYRKHGVEPHRVIVTSGKSDWNIEKLVKEKRFADNSYFIGSVNSGKSSVLKSLILASNKLDAQSRPLSARERTKLEKEQDRLINSGRSKVRKTPSDIRALRRLLEYVKEQTGPGASYMPGFTRGIIPAVVAGNTLYDVPGFGENRLVNEFPSLLRYLQPAQMKQLNAGRAVHEHGTFWSPYETIKGGQCYTVGGMFYVVPPVGTIVQVRNCINQKGHTFSNLDRAKELLEALGEEGDTLNSPHAGLRNSFVMPASSLDKLVPRYIPLFYGAVDLVVAGAGHVSFVPTGAPSNSNDPWVVWLPQGIRVWVRQPITKYTTRTLAGRDKQGNVLRRQHWKKKSVTHVERYTGKAPFCSRLLAQPDTVVATTSNRYPHWVE